MLTMEAAIFIPRATMINKTKKLLAPMANNRRDNHPRASLRITNLKTSSKMTNRMMSNKT